MSSLAFFAKPPGSKPEPFRKPKANGHDRAVLTASGTNEAYTPPAIVEAARYALGGVIDLDPCSNEVANEVVQARHFYALESKTTPYYDDVELLAPSRGGLFLPWGSVHEPTAVWLNPPGGFLDRKTLLPSKRGGSQASFWWERLRAEIGARQVKAAVYYCFRLDVLQNIQASASGVTPPQAFPFCIFKDRPRHWNPASPRERRGLDGQPTHACASFLVLPEPTNEAARRFNRVTTARFQESHSELGYVRV